MIVLINYRDNKMSQIIEGRRITVAEMAPHVHSFLPNENKVNKIAAWLEKWIIDGLKSGRIKVNDYLPKKGDIAVHTSVSLGTMQNVYRILEDKGIIASRQKVGSYIKDFSENSSEKLTSKREVACEEIKKYILENNYKQGDTFLSARKLSKTLVIPFATAMGAINRLIGEGVIQKKGKSFIISSLNFEVANIEQQTLVEKVAEHINKYIKTNLKAGDKLPSNNALADMFNVSIKTIHDAVKILSVAGVIKTRRGYYGTVVINRANNEDVPYYYEQVEQSIKKYIAENCKVGDKLPSVKNFAEVFNVSAKTIKNALDILASAGYVNFARGKYGGTFVAEIPAAYEKGYTWLALSPDFEQIN